MWNSEIGGCFLPLGPHSWDEVSTLDMTALKMLGPCSLLPWLVEQGFHIRSRKQKRPGAVALPLKQNVLFLNWGSLGEKYTIVPPLALEIWPKVFAQGSSPYYREFLISFKSFQRLNLQQSLEKFKSQGSQKTVETVMKDKAEIDSLNSLKI